MILEIIGLSCIGVLSVVAGPIIKFKRFIGFKEEDSLKFGAVKSFINELINCAMCMSFWIGLIYTHNLMLAAIVSILAEIIYKKLS